ncbi:hypothetical protein D3C81_1957780 [compost metagenome]
MFRVFFYRKPESPLLVADADLRKCNVGELEAVHECSFWRNPQLLEQTVLVGIRRPPYRCVFPQAVTVVARTCPKPELMAIQGEGNV